MNDSRFTALAQSLTAAATRRDLSRGLAGLTLGGVLASRTGGADVKARKRKKRKKGKKGNKGKNKQQDPTTTLPPSFDICVAMGNGAPCGNYGCLVCLNEICSPNPLNDGMCGADGTGRCSFGSCNPRPTCTGTEAMCPAGDASCCSGSCGGGGCGLAAPGAQCKRGEDCTTGSCIGYRCR